MPKVQDAHTPPKHFTLQEIAEAVAATKEAKTPKVSKEDLKEQLTGLWKEYGKLDAKLSSCSCRADWQSCDDCTRRGNRRAEVYREIRKIEELEKKIGKS